jgi:hypothetical protein
MSHNEYIALQRIAYAVLILEKPVFTQPADAKPRGHRLRYIALMGVVVAVLVVGAAFGSALLTKPVGQDAWLFRGAYAKYEGSTSVMGFSFYFSARLEVLDFNSTHVHLSTLFSMGSNVGQDVEEENSTWVPLSSVGFTSAFDDSNVTDTYDATIDFSGLGRRSCTVYEIATGGPTVTIYVDKTIGWPLQMKVSMTGEGTVSLSMDIKLVDTNIPGLA